VRVLRGTLKLLLFFFACWALLLVAIAVYGQRDEARAADAIVVLGAAQYNGHPSPVLEARLQHAVELYRAERMIHSPSFEMRLPSVIALKEYVPAARRPATP